MGSVTGGRAPSAEPGGAGRSGLGEPRDVERTASAQSGATACGRVAAPVDKVAERWDNRAVVEQRVPGYREADPWVCPDSECVEFSDDAAPPKCPRHLWTMRRRSSLEGPELDPGVASSGR